MKAGRPAGRELIFRFGEHTSTVLLGADPVEYLTGPGGVLAVFDTNTHRLFGPALVMDRPPVVVPPGEESKSWARAEEVLRRAVQDGLGRDGLLAGVGGGVVCDLTAFCASLYMRGCGLVLVPTTLLAMVDAALGGKTAVNLLGYKNVAGTFYPAARIVIRPDLLASLPEREYRSGLGEAIKTAMLGDVGLLEILERRQAQVRAREAGLLAEIVERCLAVKGRVVEEDFKEGGQRAILNLGHTFAHALETASSLGGWSHGEAVAWGLRAALRLGTELGITEPGYSRRVEGLLESYGFPLHPPGLEPTLLLEAMKADKKKREGRLRFVLQRGPGETLVQAVEDGRVLEFLAGL